MLNARPNVKSKEGVGAIRARKRAHDQDCVSDAKASRQGTTRDRTRRPAEFKHITKPDEKKPTGICSVKASEERRLKKAQR